MAAMRETKRVEVENIVMVGSVEWFEVEVGRV